MSNTQRKVLAAAGVMGSLCAVALALAINGTFISDGAQSGTKIDEKSWTVQDQDDADSVMRTAVASGTVIGRHEHAEVIEILDRDAAGRWRESCPPEICGAQATRTARRTDSSR